MSTQKPVYTFGCWGKDCDGDVKVEASKRPTVLVMEGGREAYAFPCSECGKMHWGNGQAVLSQDGEDVFLGALEQCAETAVAHIGV